MIFITSEKFSVTEGFHDNFIQIIERFPKEREGLKTREMYLIDFVHFIDELILILEKNQKKYSLLLSGQSIIIEDYLEIRPENKERLKRLIESKLLLIGPWYIEPDEFLVSGESLIRNLLRSRKLLGEMNNKINIGYFKNQLDHVSQLPQILEGFNIDTCIIVQKLTKNMNEDIKQYDWKSPDSTMIQLVHSLPSDPNSTKCYSILKNNQLRINKDIKDVNKSYRQITGEFDSTFKNYTSRNGNYCTRNDLKLMNDSIQILLEKFIEPLNVFSKWQGYRSYKKFLDYSWKILLQNHYHLSITGCCIDPVYREIKIRFNKIKNIYDAVLKNVTEELFCLPETDDSKKELTVFNPSPFLRNELIEAQINIFKSYSESKKIIEQKKEKEEKSLKYFRISDENGTEILYQILEQTEKCKTDLNENYGSSKPINKYTLLLDCKKLPPLGFKKYIIEYTGFYPKFKEKISIGRYFIENKWLRVDVSSKGIISVKDKQRNQYYKGLNIFEDGGDTGNECRYRTPEFDSIFLSKSYEPRISIIEEGPLRGAIKIRIRMKVPESMASNFLQRSHKKGFIKIWTIVRLSIHSQRVDFITKIENNVNDHRLRVLFSTDCKTRQSYAAAPFYITRQEPDNHLSNRSDSNNDPSVLPMSGFVTVFDKDRSISFISNGLYEYELKRDSLRTLAVTLLRSTGKLIHTFPMNQQKKVIKKKLMTPEAQCQGTYTFQYALTFHRSEKAENFIPIYHEAEKFRINPMSFIASIKTNEWANVSWLRIDPDDLHLSAFKEAEDENGFIIRIFNPSNSMVNGSIFLGKHIDEAWECRIDETNLNKLVIKELKLKIKVKPWKIFTLRIIP
jgi:mannosylglycerate hydrolase